MAVADLAELTYSSQDIDINELRSSTLNPRQSFDPEALSELAADIRAHGMIEPIVVRPVPGDTGVYEIVAGERRYRAAQQIGLKRVPIRIAGRNLTEAEALEIALAENVARSDLNPVERARATEKLKDMTGQAQTELAERLGRSETQISRSLSLLKLPAPVQQQVANGELPEASASTLVRFADYPAVCEAIAALAIENHTNEKDLRVPLPFAQKLVRMGLAFDVSADLPFGPALAKDRASYFKTAPGANAGYTLNLERYRTLKAENDTATKARTEDNRNRALGKPAAGTAPKKGGNPSSRLPMLEDMPADSYIRLDAPGAIPAGCTADACTCRGRGLLSDGNTAVNICVDKRRYNRLMKADNKSEERRLLQQHEMLDQWLGEHIKHLEAFSPLELAVIFGRSIQWLGVPAQKALDQMGIGLPDAPVQSDAFLTWLSKLDAGTILGLAFSSALREELNGDGGLRRDMSVTRWYLNAIGSGMPEPAVADATATDSDETAEDDAEDAEDDAGAAEGAMASEEAPPVDISGDTGA